MISLQKPDEMLTRLLLSKKLIFIILTSGLFTTIQGFFQKFIFDDWQYLAYLGILFLVDTLTGFLKAYKRHDLSSKGFGQIIRKMLSYFSVLILAHVMTHYEIDGEQVTMFSWVDDFAFASLILKEAISILENIAILNPAWIPKFLLKRLKQFEDL